MVEMNENALTATWVKWAAIIIVVGIAAIVGSCQMTKYRIAETIKAGADPMRARCALETNPSQYCLIQYAQPKQEEAPR